MPIRQLRLVDVALKHLYFRLTQGLLTSGIQTAAVLHPRPETRLEDASSDFVVLRVRLGGFDGYRAGTQAFDVFHLGLVGFFQGSRADGVETICKLAADTIPNDGLWQVTSVKNPVL